MTVRSAHDFLDGVWDWAILDGCFGNTKISPTDIDGMVERNGQVLFLETKKPGVEIPTGQLIAFKTLAKRRRCAVLIIWGEKQNPVKMRYITSAIDKTYDPADVKDLRLLVSYWFWWAERTSN